MPTYEYKCEKCGKHFDVMKPMADCNKEEKCSKCKVVAIKLISSGYGIIFKGTGFYQTDYKNQGK